jgi:hypothetical protein
VGFDHVKADANDAIWRKKALMSFDVSTQLPNVKARTLVIGIRDDELFPRIPFNRWRNQSRDSIALLRFHPQPSRLRLGACESRQGQQ